MSQPEVFKESDLKPWPERSLKDRYFISETGRVFSAIDNKGKRRDPLLEIVTPKGQSGYLQVILRITIDGKRVAKCFPIHRTVCTAFNGPRPSIKHIVGHLDGDMYNNHYLNLAWITPKENQEHRRIHGTMATRDNLHNAKINSRMARAIKNLHAIHGLSFADLGRAFEVKYQTISRICKTSERL